MHDDMVDGVETARVIALNLLGASNSSSVRRPMTWPASSSVAPSRASKSAAEMPALSGELSGTVARDLDS